MADLRRLTQLDLGDHLRFSYREHHDILADDTQPYTDVLSVIFLVFVGVILVYSFMIDPSGGASPTVFL